MSAAVVGRLDGLVAIVTGAANGIGAATAARFVEEGARVVITDIDASAGEALAAELGEAALFIRHDVTDHDAWRVVVARTIEHFGALHILVNNAGTTAWSTIEDASLEDWRDMMGVHADAAFFGCQQAFPAMKAAGYGAIVNISSAAGMFGFPSPVAYSAANSAQFGLVRSIAAHCYASRYPIRCNAILPGAVATQLLKAGLRRGMDEEQAEALLAGAASAREIANVALFLASREANYVNGQLIVADGGQCFSQVPPAAA